MHKSSGKRRGADTWIGRGGGLGVGGGGGVRIWEGTHMGFFYFFEPSYITIYNPIISFQFQHIYLFHILERRFWDSIITPPGVSYVPRETPLQKISAIF